MHRRRRPETQFWGSSAYYCRCGHEPNDLLVLLTVSRSAEFTTAVQTLGLNHTTISRRIAALEKALGGRVLSRAAGGWELTELGEEAVLVAEQVEKAVLNLGELDHAPDTITGVVRMTATDWFSADVAAPAVARLRRQHPGLSVEIVTVTRQALQQRSGLDIEVVVGEPQVHRAEAFKLGDYELGMYASKDYLAESGNPATEEELTQHRLVYFVDSMLQVDEGPTRSARQAGTSSFSISITRSAASNRDTKSIRSKKSSGTCGSTTTR